MVHNKVAAYSDRVQATFSVKSVGKSTRTADCRELAAKAMQLSSFDEFVRRKRPLCGSNEWSSSKSQMSRDMNRIFGWN